MASPGFEKLGELIAGGDPRRKEAAFLDGLDTGSKINARRATTANALAQARLRVDEQENREGLADSLEAMGLPREAAVSLRAGVDLQDVTKGLLDVQTGGFRDTIADVALPLDQRQASAQAIEGKVVNPLQFGPGGDLFTDVFQGGAPELTPTGPADEGLAQQRVAAAKLSDERRLNPERFKASANKNLSTGLAEMIVPIGGGTSIVPEGLNPEEAFGAEAFLKGGVNAVSDFVGLGLPFRDQAEAHNFMREMAGRIQIIMRGDVPGARPPVIVQELLGRYSEEPQQLFRGDEQAKINLNTTLTSLVRSEQRVRTLLNAPLKRTATREQVLADNLIAFTDTIADLKKIKQMMKEREDGTDGAEVTEREIGVTFDLPGGGTATRIE